MGAVSLIRRMREREADGRGSAEVGPLCLGPVVLVPGWTQWSAHERDRGFILFGTFSSAMFVGLCAWGTWLGTILLIFAFVTHVFATADAMRRGTFPPFERWIPWTTASLGLGLGCYAPLMIAASLFAWPGMRSDAPYEGYLIDRWTIRGRAPRAGDHVWVESAEGRGPWLGRVIALSGQRVEWTENSLRIDGRIGEGRGAEFPQNVGDLTLRVPNDHLLIVAEDVHSSNIYDPPSPRIVSSSRIVGIAWAKYYPIWDRRLL